MSLYEVIYLILFCCLTVFIVFFVFYMETIATKKEKKFLDNLNEHDKSVILDYKNATRYTFKGKEK